jgi:NADH-quinone oxidoreductase subunit C
MSANLNALQEKLTATLGDTVLSLTERLGELTLVIPTPKLLEVMTRLRDDEDFRFQLMIDLAGMDYSAYGSEACEAGAYAASEEAANPHSARFAVVYHLLSIRHNWRLRVRVFAEDDSMPVLDSVCGIWSCANWYEREAFDLYGIIFTGHTDLRRLLTDYGFVGSPFRKDFPLSGNVEMRYDPKEGRVVYQPVTVEPRQITPRIVREEKFGRT